MPIHTLFLSLSFATSTVLLITFFKRSRQFALQKNKQTASQLQFGTLNFSTNVSKNSGSNGFLPTKKVVFLGAENRYLYYVPVRGAQRSHVVQP